MKKISFYFSILFLTSIITIAYFLSKEKKENLNTNGVLVNGEVIVIRMGYIDYIYTVKGIYYEQKVLKPYPSIQIGEVFKILYNSKIPDEAKIILAQPVIIDSLFEKTYSQSCDFILFEDQEVKFTYEVEEEEYERMQFFPNKIEVDKNKKYLIKYKKDNPKIGYIFLDKWKE